MSLASNYYDLFEILLSRGDSSNARSKANSKARDLGYTDDEIVTARSCFTGSVSCAPSIIQGVCESYEINYGTFKKDFTWISPLELQAYELEEEDLKEIKDRSDVEDDKRILIKLIRKRLSKVGIVELIEILRSLELSLKNTSPEILTSSAIERDDL